MLQNCGCQGLRTAFYNTFFSLKLALRLVSETISNVFSEGYYVEENTQISWLRLQNCACQAFRTPFSNTFLSLRSAQKVVPKI